MALDPLEAKARRDALLNAFAQLGGRAGRAQIINHLGRDHYLCHPVGGEGSGQLRMDTMLSSLTKQNVLARVGVGQYRLTKQPNGHHVEPVPPAAPPPPIGPRVVALSARIIVRIGATTEELTDEEFERLFDQMLEYRQRVKGM